MIDKLFGPVILASNNYFAVKTSKDIRREFISFFEEKGHKFVRSSPVVPQDDPTLLFTNAGMNQFKDIFLDTGSRDYKRAVNSQKCIRASGKHNDLEDVGRDNYHHTFFEMLGNWSFGDYFKREAIRWGWELLVERWGLSPERLHATVFAGFEQEGLEPDMEAEKLWLEETPLPPERLGRHGKKDNFWEMGETGPCGPCSEVFYDLGEGSCPGGNSGEHGCGVNVDGCWRYIELWNLVFIQYNRPATGGLVPLPARHVDTGMGLERISRVLQGKDSNYDTDLFTPLLGAIAERTGVRDGPGEVGVAFRVIADHMRSLTFAISDGALPSNEGRGYVLRRMLRRAARFGKVLGMDEPFLYGLVEQVARMMGEDFPEVLARADHTARVIRAEEETFAQTLDRGLERFGRVAAELSKAKSKTIPGSEVFKLYDTYGFPADLTRMLAGEQGFEVEMEGFEELMEAQRSQAKAAGRQLNDTGEWITIGEGEHSLPAAHDKLSLTTTVHSYSHAPGGKLLLVLAETPFYAEGGGQVGDRGRIHGPAGEWKVTDVQREGGRIVHVTEGGAEPDGRSVSAEVAPAERQATSLNHTATHLLQAALKEVLGEHVNQAGSVVQPDSLRFDYTHFEKPASGQLEAVERLVNRTIRGNHPLNIYQSDYESAIGRGVTALFGEKYGDQVRVVEVPGFSSELCGGCHVGATGEIGLFKITSEGSIAAGVRRITAITGEKAEEQARLGGRIVEELKATLNAAEGELTRKVEQLLEERRRMEKELRNLKKSGLDGVAEALLAKAAEVNGVSLLVQPVEAESMDELRALADSLRKNMRSGVAVIAAVIRNKGSILCVVTEDLVRKNVKAGEIVSRVARLAGGRGGGPPHMATAGAKETGKIPLALEQAPDLIRDYLAGLQL